MFWGGIERDQWYYLLIDLFIKFFIDVFVALQHEIAKSY